MLTSPLPVTRQLAIASLWCVVTLGTAQADEGKTAIDGPWYSQGYHASSADFTDSSASPALLAIPGLPSWSAYISQQTPSFDYREPSLVAGLRYQWTPAISLQSQLRQGLWSDSNPRHLELASSWAVYPALSVQASYGTAVNLLDHAFSLGASYRF